MKKYRSAKSGSGTETPLMRQYTRIKTQYPDALLLFRIGDFYETFGEDAKITSRVLGIVLTKRNNGGGAETELAGFPHHSIESYLPRLVRAGYRVAVCDQLEDPKLAKTIVERGVTEVITPGVAFSDRVIDHRSNNWLAAIAEEKGRYGIAFLDVTTGEFLVGEGDATETTKFMDGHAPSELLHTRSAGDPLITQAIDRYCSYALDEWAFTDDFARERLLGQFGTSSLKGFGIEELKLGQRAAGAVLHYLGETRHDRLAHINRIARLQAGSYVGLDRFTVRNLELVAPVHDGARTLLQAMDRCITPMGSRMLRRWLLFPLLDRDAIDRRLDTVQAFVSNSMTNDIVSEELRTVGDLERLTGKAATGRINPRELLQLHRALRSVDRARIALRSAGDALAHVAAAWSIPLDVADHIAASIEAEAPHNVQKGGVIKSGVNTELDELRHVTTHAKELLLGIQQSEAERTGITSLKVGYNNVFGYYLEVRHTHKHKVPVEWVRKQTLTGAERYITDELKALEERILSAEERILALEAQLYHHVVDRVCKDIAPLQVIASAVAELDVLRGFAANAVAWKYVRPVFTDGNALEIKNGRHPVIEQQLPAGVAYIANDLKLDPDANLMLSVLILS